MSTGLRSSMEDRACRVDDMKPVLAKAKSLEQEYKKKECRKGGEE